MQNRVFGRKIVFYEKLFSLFAFNVDIDSSEDQCSPVQTTHSYRETDVYAVYHNRETEKSYQKWTHFSIETNVCQYIAETNTSLNARQKEKIGANERSEQCSQQCSYAPIIVQSLSEEHFSCEIW